MTSVSQGHRFVDLPEEKSYCERCNMWLLYFAKHRKENGVSCEAEQQRQGIVNGNYPNKKEVKK